MKHLLIVWHSQSGSCARLAHMALNGARQVEDITTLCIRSVDAGSDEVADADGLLLVAAENSGRLAGGAKDFLDRIFYPLQTAGRVMPVALLVSAGNDGRGAVAEAERILGGIPFTVATEPLIIRGQPQEPELDRAVELGEAFATGLSLGMF